MMNSKVQMQNTIAKERNLCKATSLLRSKWQEIIINPAMWPDLTAHDTSMFTIHLVCDAFYQRNKQEPHRHKVQCWLNKVFPGQFKDKIISFL